MLLPRAFLLRVQRSSARYAKQGRPTRALRGGSDALRRLLLYGTARSPKSRLSWSHRRRSVSVGGRFPGRPSQNFEVSRRLGLCPGFEKLRYGTIRLG